MIEPILPAGYTARPPAIDAEEVATLICTCQVMECDEAQMTVKELGAKPNTRRLPWPQYTLG